MEKRTRRLDIFRQVQDGLVSLEEASRQLADLEENDGFTKPVSEAAAVESIPAASVWQDSQTGPAPDPGNPVEVKAAEILEAESPRPEEQPVEDYRSPGGGGWWLLAFVPGLLLTLASANWMVQGYTFSGLGWGFWLSFIPFFVGIALMWLGWEIRQARWMHILVRQKPGSSQSDIRIHFPLPTGWVSWSLRRFGHFSSEVNRKDVADLLDEFDKVETSDPFHISVDDRDGEQVEIWVDGPNRK